MMHCTVRALVGSAVLTTLAVPASGLAQATAGGPYQLRNAASCIASGTATGADLVLEPCSATAPDQAFYLVTATGGTFGVQSDANGGVFDVTGASADVGAALLSWQSNGAANQRFAFNTRGADAYELRPAHATDRCVAAQGDGSVRLAACDAASAAQSWQLVGLDATPRGNPRDCTADELYRPRFVENTQGGPTGSNVVIMTGGYMMLIFAFDSGGPPGILTTYDVTDPRRPVQVGRIDDAHTARFREAHSLPVALASGRQYVAIQTIDGIQFWDLTDPLGAQYVSQIDLPGVSGGDYENVAWQADWQGNNLYVAGANQGIYVVDTTDISNPELITQVPTGRTGGFRVGPLYARGPYLVIGNMDQNGAISVLDIARPDQPALLGTIDGLPRMYAITATGDRIYGAGRDGDFTIHSFEDPTTIEEVKIARIEQDSLYVAAQDHFVFSGRQDNFVKIDITDEMNPMIVGEGALERDHPDHGQVTPLGNWVFVGNDHGSGSAFFCHAETDDLPLAVGKIFPADGSVQQDPLTQITIVFSDYVDTTTVNATNVTIRPSGGEPLEGVYTYNFNTLSFSPNEPFAQNTTIEIALGADGVKDVSGNPLGEAIIARFSTGDSIVIAPSPVEPDAGVMMGGSGGTGGTAATTSGTGGAASVGTGGMGAAVPSSTAGASGMTTAQPVAGTSGGGGGEAKSDAASSGCSCRIGPRERRSPVGLFAALAAAAAWLGRRRARVRGRAMTFLRALFPVIAVLCVSAASGTAHALVVSARENAAVQVGTAMEFTATAMGAGAISYTWDFGDGTRLEPMDSATVEHTFTAPGHYVIIVIAHDDSGVRSDSFVQTVHHPLTAQPPSASSTIVYDPARDRVCTVNPDHDSVSCLDGASLARSFEASVGEHPRTLALDGDGALWVTNDGSSSISIVDASGELADSVALPYGSHPFGIAKSPTSDVMFVAATGTGQLIALSTTTRAVVGSVDVGPSATGVAVSGDGERVLITRFISPVDHGEVTEVSASGLQVVRRFELADNPGPDTEATSRGVPNYLQSVLLTPDGRGAWVLSKQDNVARGVARDGMPLTFETTTRTVLSVLDLEQNQERLDARVDINNRSLGLAGALTPVGDYLFVALLGTNGVDVLDTFDGNSVGGRRELGAAPDGVALGANGRLYVHAFLSRSVLVLDASGVLSSTDFSLPLLMEAKTVASERLDADVLQGKQIFYDASDTRMTRDGYIVCATCHLDGDSDGRVWDFTSRGEGLRNTTSLLGKRGTGQGPLHWTANFDEVQDFEHDIRNAFGGTGFMSDADFMTGTRNQTLGDAKAGVSVELDALAAYLESLDQVPASPFRDPDGTLTEDGRAGHALFETAGCPECHGGPDFTDSPAGMRHDVGTLSATSGQRLGGPLDGLDTPTLRGIWQTAPYLHDGSAATLLDAVASPDDRHGHTRELSAEQQDQLVSYLLQIDNTSYEDESELPAEAGSGGAGGEVGTSDGAAGEAGGVAPVAAPAASSSSKSDGGGCNVSTNSETAGTPQSVLALALLLLCVRARTRPSRPVDMEVSHMHMRIILSLNLLVACVLPTACAPDEIEDADGDQPAVTAGTGGASGGGMGGAVVPAGSAGWGAGAGGLSGGAGAGGVGGSSGGAGAGGVGGSGGSGVEGVGGAGSGEGGVGGSAGSGTGGDGGGGGGGSTATCPLPTSFSWTSSGPLAEPQSPANHDFVSLKDFTITRTGDTYAVYATAFDSTTSWTGVYFGFSDFSEIGSATQTWLGNRATVAPQLMYFTPKDVWVLTYQWGFQYATSTDPNDPDGWSQGSSLLTGNPTTGQGGTGPIDQTVICDSTDCYLFFAGDNGRIYRGSMPIDDFPAAFTNATQIMEDTTAKLFEAVEVYSIRGGGEYLMIVEAMGSGGRYFRAFTTDTLGGTFTAMPQASSEDTPFAGKENVTFEGSSWTNDISHGDIVREDPSEKKPIDPCNLRMLYQGRNPAINVDYGLLPYRPGLLTLMPQP